MKSNTFLTKVSSIASKAGFTCKKYSPEILITVGIVGVVSSTVMACKATTKLSTILDETKETSVAIHEMADKQTDEYTTEDMQKDLAITYVQTGVKIAKLYGPSLIIGSLSIASIFASNNILRRRNVAITAAYVAVDKAFKEYRGRVVERYGNEVDYQILHNVKSVEIQETIVDAKGKEKTVTKKVDVADPNASSLYSMYFNESTSVYFNPNNWDYNMMLLKSQQSIFNDLLQSKGVVTLNSVFAALGIEETKAGMVVGWLYSKDENKAIGDNFIDFGIGETYIQTEDGGCRRVITLDFNVDGNIYKHL